MFNVAKFLEKYETGQSLFEYSWGKSIPLFELLIKKVQPKSRKYQRETQDCTNS